MTIEGTRGFLDAPAITISSLTDNGLIQNSWRGSWLTVKQEEALRGILSGKPMPGQSRHATEPIATKFLTMTSGVLEQTVIRVFCAAAKVEPKTSYRLISGAEFSKYYHLKKSGQQIDLVVVDRELWANGGPRASAIEGATILAIEAKFAADVAKIDNCQRHEGYSNQIVCYPAGCANEALVHPAVKFVWLGLSKKSEPSWPPTSAVTESWIKRQKDKGVCPQTLDEYRRTLANQQGVTEQGVWSLAVWDDLYRAVELSLVDEGLDREVTAAVLRAMGRRVESARD